MFLPIFVTNSLHCFRCCRGATLCQRRLLQMQSSAWHDLTLFFSLESSCQFGFPALDKDISLGHNDHFIIHKYTDSNAYDTHTQVRLCMCVCKWKWQQQLPQLQTRSLINIYAANSSRRCCCCCCFYSLNDDNNKMAKTNKSISSSNNNNGNKKLVQQCQRCMQKQNKPFSPVNCYLLPKKKSFVLLKYLAWIL